MSKCVTALQRISSWTNWKFKTAYHTLLSLLSPKWHSQVCLHLCRNAKTTNHKLLELEFRFYIVLAFQWCICHFVWARLHCFYNTYITLLGKTPLHRSFECLNDLRLMKCTLKAGHLQSKDTKRNGRWESLCNVYIPVNFSGADFSPPPPNSRGWDEKVVKCPGVRTKKGGKSPNPSFFRK